MLEQHITRLTEELHLPPPQNKDANGYFPMLFADKVKIALRDLSPGFIIRGNIALLPKQDKEKILIYVMQANFLGQGTGKQVIGLDEEEKFLTLSLTIPYEVSYKKFKELVEEFVNYLFYWQGDIQKMQSLSTTS